MEPIPHFAVDPKTRARLVRMETKKSTKLDVTDRSIVEAINQVSNKSNLKKIKWMAKQKV